MSSGDGREIRAGFKATYPRAPGTGSPNLCRQLAFFGLGSQMRRPLDGHGKVTNVTESFPRYRKGPGNGAFFRAKASTVRLVAGPNGSHFCEYTRCQPLPRGPNAWPICREFRVHKTGNCST